MIPKIIHLCWFGDDPYPVEIKMCLDTWHRVLPDYEVRLWKKADALSINIPFINEALEARRWAFAADVVRVYAVYTYGGIYMDSDIYLYKRFDEFLPSPTEEDAFVTFHDKVRPDEPDDPNGNSFGPNGAFFIGTKGNTFCKEMLAHYTSRHYRLPDGSYDNTESPSVMRAVARHHGYVCEDRLQRLGALTVYPTKYLAPRKNYPRYAVTFARHRTYGSWRKRKLGRRLELMVNHVLNLMKYALRKRGKQNASL